jgi:hypothetical protein
MMGKKREGWEECIVIPVHGKGDKQEVENYRGISLLSACFKLYSKSSNEKFNAKAEKFLSECRYGFRKGRSCIDPLFSMKLVQKKKRVRLETHLAFRDYVKAFEMVKIENCLKNFKAKNIPNLL